MDASASPKPDADINNVFNFFLQFDDIDYPSPSNQKCSVIKYTRLPDFDFDTKVSWPPHSYTLKPRLRRIIALDEDELLMSGRSLKPDQAILPKRMMASTNSYSKRKIVTISEDDESNLHPEFSNSKKSLPVKNTSRQSEEDFKNKQSPNKITSRLSNSNKYPKDTKTNIKSGSAFNNKEVHVAQQICRGRPLSSAPAENSRIKTIKEKDRLRSSRNLNATYKNSVSKNCVTSSESEKEITKIKNILYDNLNYKTTTCKRPVEKSKPNKLPILQNKHPKSLQNVTPNKARPVTVHVPLGGKCIKRNKNVADVPHVLHTVDCASETDAIVQYRDAETATNPLPKSISRMTEMTDFQIKTITTCDSTIQTDSKETLFDSLEIPNVTLTKDKSESKDSPKILNSTSLPNLKVPPVKIVPQKEEVNSSDISYCHSSSYIISRATVTYTTRQKFNFQLVGNDDDHVGTSLPPSPLDYPVNVVSVFKNELKNKKTNACDSSDDSYKKKNTPREDYLNHVNDMKTLNCSYVFNKLIKPSDIISTIRVNNGLLQSDYICEQFQRELNFIDSFFESLQYLETCSLTDNCYPENKVENFTNNSVLFDSTFDVKNLEYDNFLSKLENGAKIDDNETMASKSLCLLNLLIRDEQRRAKNLLFVLKMREDALKDFTKSQILWLEKKKKHDNTDISTLKKKQRGALLKLQHECGEMQRMRKALLTLSEKRKVALMKTKKNIELKLKNNVDVDQIILGKKKLKRSSCIDRNAVPLKCFDLSSSGCEESSTSKATLDSSLFQAEVEAPPCEVKAPPCEVEAPQCEVEAPQCEVVGITSAEKCVQTSDVSCAVDHATDTAAENFVVVDGGYLNILFHNLALPEIFSSSKQYEVNEEALRNIVKSANSHNNSLSGTDVVEKLMDQIKNKDSDRSCSSPSTARSLIEEFDQYYKDLHEGDTHDTPEIEIDKSSNVCEIKDSGVQAGEVEYEQPEARISLASSEVTITSKTASRIKDGLSKLDEPQIWPAAAPVEIECEKEPVITSQAPTGPLPVPVGAAAVVDNQPPDVPTWIPPNIIPSSSSESESVSSQSLCGSMSSIASLTSPVHVEVHVEAEELRRQQLAIEREIKALEQQQCRLLVVREIPDKPPPPYTPPTETRTPKPPRMFTPDENLEEKVEKHITDPDATFCESTDAFSLFVKDYCQESIERHKQEQSDMPWDACNLLPQKPQVGIHELVEKTSTELKDVLTTIMPAAVSGVSSRRSDHIDDILFAEWRRCEPEWTTLHTDEAIVKNQVFESIFQKILTDTVDEYKKIVQGKVVVSK